MTPDVANALGFTLDDLVFNRVGKLSAVQAAELTRQGLGSVGITMALVGVGMILAFYPGVGSGRTLVGVLLMILGAIVGAISVQSILATRAGHVIMTEGLFASSGPPDANASKVMVGSFRLPDAKRAAALRVLSAGQSYRVYFLRGTNDFLSLEAVAHPGDHGPSPSHREPPR
jgi:hypothetical protein